MHSLFHDGFSVYRVEEKRSLEELWIAVVSENQAIPITTGILGTNLAYSYLVLPDWLIWKWPSLDNQWNEPLYNVFLGLGVGFILYVIGMLDFVRRDVK